MGDVSEPGAGPDQDPRRKNLRPPFGPGNRANPTGKNQYTDSPARQFEAALQAKARDRAEQIIETLVAEAERGNERMMAMVLERMARKVEHIDESTGDTRATKLEVVFVKPPDAEE